MPLRLRVICRRRLTLEPERIEGIFPTENFDVPIRCGGDQHVDMGSADQTALPVAEDHAGVGLLRWLQGIDLPVFLEVRVRRGHVIGQNDRRRNIVSL